MAASDNLKKWFDELPRQDQEEVVKFLYAGKMLLQEGMYVGPHPNAVYRGLHCGPVPASTASCPTCGKPY
jgi:hypothetical protein